MKPWYEELFTNYANAYDKESFTQGTVAEVDFIETEIQSDRSKTILDIGCGTGRHAIELAKRGYSVVGIDLSESQLQKAREKAQREGVQVNFLQADARHFNFEISFDLVITITDDDGDTKNLKCNERYYAPSEITWLLKSLGFENIAIHGCHIGNFSRDNNLTTENLEMLVIAQK